MRVVQTNIMNKLRSLFFGTGSPPGHHLEKFVSGLGALLAIFCVGAVNAWVLPDAGMPLVVVACARYLPHPHLAAAVAVGLALLVMYYLHCLHPPGGATALNAVLGGTAVHDLSYQYVFAPVMLDALIIVGVAVLFNYIFPWRRYPIALSPPAAVEAALPDAALQSHIAPEDLRYALDQMGSFVDVSEHELSQIIDLAVGHAEATRMQPSQILLGRCYSNGRPGADWSVRKVIDESGVATSPDKDKVIYRVMGGRQLRATGTCTRGEFAHWAKYEVVEKNGVWDKVGRAERPIRVLSGGAALAPVFDDSRHDRHDDDRHNHETEILFYYRQITEQITAQHETAVPEQPAAG